jgi:phage shock protein A
MTEDRKKALMEELASEQDALIKAREALAQQESIRQGDERNYARVLERLKPYQDQVAAHEKKIGELRQELANLR